MKARILIADDEAGLREVFSEALEPHYAVVTAANGVDALKILRSTPGIQLLLSDIRMPELNGFKLAEEALIWNPDLKIILMTGYTAEVPPASLLKAREIRTLRKPFGLASLRNLVEEMLSRP